MPLLIYNLTSDFIIKQKIQIPVFLIYSLYPTLNSIIIRVLILFINIIFIYNDKK